MLFRALILRPLRTEAARTLLSLLAIALGVAVVVAIRVANRSAVASFRQTTNQLAGGADLLVQGPEPLSPALLARLAPVEADAEITPYLDRRAFAPRWNDTLEVLGLDVLGALGTGPRLALPLAFARRHGLRVGDQLTLTVGGRARRFAVASLLPAGLQADAAELALMDMPTALATFEPNRPVGFDGLRVVLAPGAKAAAVRARLRALVPAADTVAPPSARAQQDAKMLAAFSANLAALSYVSLLVGMFLIYNTVSISVVRRRLAIATVRALGATRARVLSWFLGEGTVLGLAGGVAGLGLGWLLAAGALHLVEGTVNNLYAPSAAGAARLSPGDALWALALAALAGAGAAWAPAWQAAGIRPALALRRGSEELAARAHAARWWIAAGGLALGALALAHLPEPGAVPIWGFASALAAVLAWAAAAPLLLAAALPRLRRFFLRDRHRGSKPGSVPGAGETSGQARSHAYASSLAAIAAAGLAGAPRRTSVLTVALATAIGVMLGVAIMVGSFRQTVEVWIGQQLQADVFVRASDWDRDRPAALDPAVVEAAASVPGVAAVERGHTEAWRFAGEPISLRLAPAPGLPQEYSYLAGHGPDALNSAAVSEPFARHFHLWAGDRLDLPAPPDARGALRLTVSGVFYDYATDRGLVLVNRATFARAFGPASVTELGLYAAPGVSSAELRRRVARRLANVRGVDIHDNRSLRAEAMGVFDQTFRITYALEVITLLVAVLGVGNTLLAVVLERAREFAILRFLGATRGQIGRILLMESGLIATFALGLGWAMAGALALILVRVINVQSFGWTIQFHLPYAFLLPASAAVWLVTVAAGWLPARAAQRQDPLAAVGSE